MKTTKKTTKTEASQPHEFNPVDIHVGAKVRMRRKILGLSQQALAEGVGLTFQQVQKYESGANRISASKIYEIAKVLNTSVGYYFEGLGKKHDIDGFSETEAEQFVSGFLLTTDGIELAGCFPKIKNPRHRRRLLELVRSFADDEEL